MSEKKPRHSAASPEPGSRSKVGTRRGAKRRHLLLVLGMHRSGTSALTGVLAKLGVELGEELLPPTRDNRKGYFENARVVAAQEELFGSLHRTWQDPRPLPEGWAESAVADHAREVLTELVEGMFANASAVAVKDPRSCRVVPVWHDVAKNVDARPAALLMLRHPNEVAESLRKRDGMSRSRAHLLWMRYLLDAERDTREMLRCFVSYEALLSDWRSELARIDKAIAGALPPIKKAGAHVDDFLDVSLRSHASVPSQESTSPFETIALELYGLVLHCAIDPAGSRADREFGEITRKLERVAAYYLHVPLQLEDELHRQRIDRSRIDMSLQLAALRELWRPALAARVAGASQLFYRDAATTYAEARAVLAEPVLVEGGQKVTFTLPAGINAEYLRMDPDDAPGVFSIQSISVDGKIIEDFAARVTEVSEFALPVTSTRVAIRFAALGEDPHFEIDARGLTQRCATHPQEVEVHFQSETVLSEIVGYLKDSSHDLQSRQQELYDQQQRLADSLGWFKQHVSVLGESSTELSSAVSALQSMGPALHLAMDDEYESQRREFAQMRDLVNAFRQEAENAWSALEGRLAGMYQTQRDEIAQLYDAAQKDHHVTADALGALSERMKHLSRIERNEIASLKNDIHQDRDKAERTWARIDTRIGEGFRQVMEELRAARMQNDDVTRSLEQLRLQQDVLLNWARRRSPRYWWERVTARNQNKSGARMRASDKFSLIPLANLQRDSDIGKEHTWVSSTDDPQFLLRGSQSFLEAGWYMFEADFENLEGPLMAPCLYPDYGTGVAESGRVLLPDPDEHGRIRAVILLKHKTTQLRFDPSMRIARFGLEEVILRRLGRVEALVCMATSVAAYGPEPDWRRMGGVLLAFARAASAGGFRKGGDAAYARYMALMHPVVDDYAAWVRSYDTLNSADIALLRAEVDSLSARPLISILMPVYETSESWLRKCIDSVIAQVYPNWELCIADDASPSRHVRKVLEEYIAKDSRIHVTFRENNGHISEASNSALKLATGEYISLLDHDDELRPHALLEVVKAISESPNVGLVYSDEDKIDANGRRFDPYFKPDWDPDLLRSQNYICHFTTIRATLLRDVGGFSKGLEGSQDHDLILRCTERLQSSQIAHIPKILYHWRAIPGSTALTRDAKDYASSAGARAVAAHLDRCHPGATVEELSHGHYHVIWPLPESPPKVSLIVPTRDKVELLRICIESIFAKTTYSNFEVIVVDNQSSDEDSLVYLSELERKGGVKVLRYDAAFNYSAINNWAVGQCDGEVVGLVNNDVEVISADWLQEMVAHALRPDVGAVGAMLYYPDDTIQHAGVVLGVHGVAAHAYARMPRGYPGHGGRARVVQSVSAVTAACLLVRRRVFVEVGGLDESLSVAFNDVDFCVRLLASGYRNVWTPHSTLYHHESASRGYEDTPEKVSRFNAEVNTMISRWGDTLLVDPRYNPNLTVAGTPFELAFPPRADRSVLARPDRFIGHPEGAYL